MSDEGSFPRFGEASAELRARIDRVSRPWSHPVDILPVTKGFSERAIEVAVDHGYRVVGENYAQEIIAKRATIERLGVEVHFIGHLQSNKIRQVAGLVSTWSSIDRPSVVDELAKRAAGARIRIQVNTTAEPQKGGCAPVDVDALVDRARRRGLVVEGLMTVGPTDAPAEAARSGFGELRSMVDRLGLAVCSMGMTGDLEVAVEEGSTEIRIGTALFGPRPDRPRLSTPENPS
jgi:pyridoxal phosphate enzyme (YggS family)